MAAPLWVWLYKRAHALHHLPPRPDIAAAAAEYLRQLSPECRRAAALAYVLADGDIPAATALLQACAWRVDRIEDADARTRKLLASD